MPTETPTRSIVKAVTWQLMGLVTMTLIALAITGDLTASSGLAIVSALTGFVCFILHERVWARVKWGRGQANPARPRPFSDQTVTSE